MVVNILKKLGESIGIFITNPLGAILWLIVPGFRKEVVNPMLEVEKSIQEHERSKNEYKKRTMEQLVELNSNKDDISNINDLKRMSFNMVLLYEHNNGYLSVILFNNEGVNFVHYLRSQDSSKAKNLLFLYGQKTYSNKIYMYNDYDMRKFIDKYSNFYRFLAFKEFSSEILINELNQSQFYKNIEEEVVYLMKNDVNFNIKYDDIVSLCRRNYKSIVLESSLLETKYSINYVNEKGDLLGTLKNILEVIDFMNSKIDRNINHQNCLIRNDVFFSNIYDIPKFNFRLSNRAVKIIHENNEGTYRYKLVYFPEANEYKKTLNEYYKHSIPRSNDIQCMLDDDGSIYLDYLLNLIDGVNSNCRFVVVYDGFVVEEYYLNPEKIQNLISLKKSILTKIK